MSQRIPLSAHSAKSSHRLCSPYAVGCGRWQSAAWSSEQRSKGFMVSFVLISPFAKRVGMVKNQATHLHPRLYRPVSREKDFSGWGQSRRFCPWHERHWWCRIRNYTGRVAQSERRSPTRDLSPLRSLNLRDLTQIIILLMQNLIQNKQQVGGIFQ